MCLAVLWRSVTVGKRTCLHYIASQGQSWLPRSRTPSKVRGQREDEREREKKIERERENINWNWLKKIWLSKREKQKWMMGEKNYYLILKWENILNKDGEEPIHCPTNYEGCRYRDEICTYWHGFQAFHMPQCFRVIW